MIYYQTDISAYTSSAGILTPLDYLFEWREGGKEIAFDASRGRLRFAPPTQEMMDQLESAVKRHS